MPKAKSAMDRLLATAKRDLVYKLNCPDYYGLTGAYTTSQGCQVGSLDHLSDEEFKDTYCLVCWTKKF